MESDHTSLYIDVHEKPRFYLVQEKPILETESGVRVPEGILLMRTAPALTTVNQQAGFSSRKIFNYPPPFEGEFPSQNRPLKYK